MSVALQLSPAKLREHKEALEKEISAVEQKTASFRKEEESLIAEIDKLTAKLKAVQAKRLEIERPKSGATLADMKNGLGVISRALGGRTMSEGVAKKQAEDKADEDAKKTAVSGDAKPQTATSTAAPKKEQPAPAAPSSVQTKK